MSQNRTNKTLVLCSKGVGSQHKLVLKDLSRLLPNSKKEAKIDRKEHFSAIKDLAELHSCNNFIYLEGRKRIAYLWVGHFPNGPSIKFLVQNLHPSNEIRLNGNCLQGTRPLLSFDSSFAGAEHLKLIQQIFMQAFSLPEGHPKSMPFIDHIFSFSHALGQIFFRNFELALDGKKEVSLVEIGPRFNLTIVKVLDGVVSGETLYKNGSFVPPRREISERVYEKRLKKKVKREVSKDGVDFYDVYGD